MILWHICYLRDILHRLHTDLEALEAVGRSVHSLGAKETFKLSARFLLAFPTFPAGVAAEMVKTDILQHVQQRLGENWIDFRVAGVDLQYGTKASSAPAKSALAGSVALNPGNLLATCVA